jgi:hypothetical protein
MYLKTTHESSRKILLRRGNWTTNEKSSTIKRAALFGYLDHTNRTWMIKEFLAKRELCPSQDETYINILNVILDLGQHKVSIDYTYHFCIVQFFQQVA